MNQDKAKLVVLWTAAADSEGFRLDYEGKHMSIARRLPNVIALSHGRIRFGEFVLCAELTFASATELKSSLAGEVGLVLTADADRLKETFGVTSSSFIVHLDSEEVVA